MSQQSLADKLVFFMRVRDEAKRTIDAMPHESDAWPQLGMMLEQQEQVVRDALHHASLTADRLGRLAQAVIPQPEGPEGSAHG